MSRSNSRCATRVIVAVGFSPPVASSSRGGGQSPPDCHAGTLASHSDWVYVVLIWVGFGSLAGLLARVILPLEHRPVPCPR